MLFILFSFTPLSLGFAQQLPAPDFAISVDQLPDKLSDFKGKVVYLDFWASWCRPCRRANPHVVEMYKKYKRKGFDVFNVSFDGLDDKRLAAYQNDKATIAKAMDLEKSKWKQAIQQDKLTWKNHLPHIQFIITCESELKIWDALLSWMKGLSKKTTGR